MKKESQYSIVHIVSNENFVEFQKTVKDVEKKHTIIRKRIGVSMVSLSNGQQMGVIAIPWCYFELECTEQEYSSWIFQQKILK